MHHRVTQACAGAGAICVLLAGCTGTRSYVPPAGAAPNSVLAAGPAAIEFKGTVFVSDTEASAVWACPTNDLRRGFAPPCSQLEGVSRPVQMAVDRSGTLYVANAQVGLSGAGKVTIYARGKRTPSRTLRAGLDSATGVAVDSVGNVYVSNKYAGSIVEFAPGKLAPAATFTANLVGPDGLAVDRKDDVFVADGSANDVLEIVHGATTPHSLHLEQLARPIGIAVDGRGNLYVSNLVGDKSRINVYAPNSTKPARSFIVYGPVFNGATIGEPVMLSIAPGDVLLASGYLAVAYIPGGGWFGGDSVVAAYAPGRSSALWSFFPGASTSSASFTPDDAVFQPEAE
ncbi:MAG TPA: hypothetical protein VMF61_13845 [Candidatus Acidoferrales bacterium]|nr:hypothetical protein [Candidatus Acidoferrales bacterium]